MKTPGRKQLSKTSINTLSAIHRYRHQRRSGRVWLIGDKRISASTIAGLEREAFVREVAFNGSPVLVLTDEGKRLVASVGR
jgi:hypothetical protein